jgi:hypothetical protein
VTNTYKFWISSVPTSVLTYLVLHSLFRLLKKYNINFRLKIVNFKWFTILFVNLLLKNIQLLAFRAFQQLLYGQSPSLQIKHMYFINEILCIIALFFVVICTFTGQFIVRIMINNNIKYWIDNVWYSESAVWYLIITQLVRITNGFIFCCQFFNNLTKVSILFSTQISILCVIVSFRNYFRRKTMLVLLIA